MCKNCIGVDSQRIGIDLADSICNFLEKFCTHKKQRNGTEARKEIEYSEALKCLSVKMVTTAPFGHKYICLIDCFLPSTILGPKKMLNYLKKYMPFQLTFSYNIKVVKIEKNIQYILPFLLNWTRI